MYRYKNKYFKDSWHLAYWIYCEDKKIELTDDPEKTKIHVLGDYYTTWDFLENNDKYIFIKGKYYQENTTDTLKWMTAGNKLKIIGLKEMKPILKYIYKKYGRNYLKKFQVKTDNSFKRKVIDYDSLKEEEFKKLKKRNVKFKYKCKECGATEYTTWRLIDHFKDNLCRHCRKKHQKEEKESKKKENQ